MLFSSDAAEQQAPWIGKQRVALGGADLAPPGGDDHSIEETTI